MQCRQPHFTPCVMSPCAQAESRCKEETSSTFRALGSVPHLLQFALSTICAAVTGHSIFAERIQMSAIFVLGRLSVRRRCTEVSSACGLVGGFVRTREGWSMLLRQKKRCAAQSPAHVLGNGFQLAPGAAPCMSGPRAI